MVLTHLVLDRDRQTMASLMNTSKQNYDLVGPQLYEDVQIDRSNASSFFRGMARVRPNPNHRWIRKRVPVSPRSDIEGSSTDEETSFFVDDATEFSMIRWPEIAATSEPESDTGVEETETETEEKEQYRNTESKRRKRELFRFTKTHRRESEAKDTAAGSGHRSPRQHVQETPSSFG